MFRVYLGPSSGGTTVCIQQLVLIGFQSNQDNRQPQSNQDNRQSQSNQDDSPNPTRTTQSQSKQDNRQSSKKNSKYQLYTYGCTS